MFLSRMYSDVKYLERELHRETEIDRLENRKINPGKNANQRLVNCWSIFKLKTSHHDYVAIVDEE